MKNNKRNIGEYPETKLYTFIKFGAQQYMESLLTKGTLHCKTRHYFATLNDGTTDGRADPYENVVNVRNDIDRITLTDPKTKKQFKIAVTSGQFRQSINLHESSGNLYCIYAYDFAENFQGVGHIHHLNVGCEIDNYFILVRDAPEFSRRIKEKLYTLGLSYDYGLVSYKDFKKINGKITPFIKDIQYEQQNEYRFYIHNPINVTLEFDIGSIEDIASMHPITDLPKIPWKAEKI